LLVGKCSNGNCIACPVIGEYGISCRRGRFRRSWCGSRKFNPAEFAWRGRTRASSDAMFAIICLLGTFVGICSSRVAGLKSRTSFYVINSTSPWGRAPHSMDLFVGPTIGFDLLRHDVQTRSTGTANTYPTPRSVWMTRGALGSRSSLRRRRRICTSMLRSKTSSWTRVACSRCSRLSGRCGASRKAINRAYSPLVNVTAAPAGSVSSRVLQSSCQPQNRKRPRSGSRAGAARPISNRRNTARTRASNSRRLNGFVR
jgi:hypothetical protein